MIVLADGENNGSGTLGYVVTQANELNIPIFAVGLGSDLGLQDLETLTAHTGGAYAHASDADGLRAIYANIGFGITEGRVIVTADGRFDPQLMEAGRYTVGGVLVTTIGGNSVNMPFQFNVNVVEDSSPSATMMLQQSQVRHGDFRPEEEQ